MQRGIMALTLWTIAHTSAMAEVPSVIGWNNIGQFLTERYAAIAAGGSDLELLERRYSETSPLRLDPKLNARIARQSIATKSESRSVGISQVSPFGSELGVTITRSRGPDTTTGQEIETESRSLQLKQQLLKNGPWHGLATQRRAELERELGLLQADLALEKSLSDAYAALATVQLTVRTLLARTKARERAEAQHRSVQQLVSSGYRAKADLLISEAILLRSTINHSEAVQDAAEAYRKLLIALFLPPESAELKVAEDPPARRWIERLEALTWPTPIPQTKISQLESALAKLKADIAQRDDLPELTVALAFDRTIPTDQSQPAKLTRTIELGLSTPIRSALKRDRAAITSIEADQAQANLAQAERIALTVHENLRAKIKTADERLATAKQLFALAAQTLTIEQEKYSDGKSTIAEVRRVQDDVENAQLALIAADQEHLLARIAWAQASGQLAETLP